MDSRDIYHEMIVDYSRNPVNFGRLEDPDVTYHDANPLCGDSIDMALKIDDSVISDIKFHGHGCAICMACSSVLTEITKGKTLDDARNISKHDVLGELGLERLQAVRIKCALLPLKTLKFALYKYITEHMAEHMTKDADSLKDEAAGLY